MSFHSVSDAAVTNLEIEAFLADPCCEGAAFQVWEMDKTPDDVRGRDHSGECENYDGAPDFQWEVTEGAGYSPDTRDKHDPTL